MKKISVVVPCYNEEQVLPELFKRITKAAITWNLDWDVVCIDDGSTDSTYDFLRSQHKKDKRWKLVSLSRNFGHQAAITCGLNYATGDAVIILDADLQDPPEVLKDFIKKWRQGYEVVYAVRTQRKESSFKKLGYWLFYRFLQKISQIQIPLDSGDFCLMDRKVVNVLNQMPEQNRFVRGLRAWAGFKQIGVVYERKPRFAGDSKYPFKKLLKLAMDGVLSFSAVPLTLASYFGLWISAIAFLGIIFTLAQRIFEDFFQSIGIGPVPGYATTVIAVLFLGGVQLVFLGIIGYYLSRIYDEVKRRPQWVIKEKVGFRKGNNGL